MQRAAGQSCTQCSSAHCYGVTVDMDGNTWCGGYDSHTLTIFPVTGGPPVEFDTTINNSCDHGIAVTPIDNHIWVAHSGLLDGPTGACKDPDSRVSRFSYDSVSDTLTLCETLTVGLRPTGIAVDANGHVYVTNTIAETVSRIIPAQIATCTDYTGPPSQVAFLVSIPDSEPDDYGTMTGLLALQTSGTGTWTAVHDGDVYGGRWSRVLWNQEADCPLMPVPTGTSLTVGVRAADTQAGLASQQYLEVQNNVLFTGIRGRYIQVMVRLKGSPVGQPFATPVLCDLEIMPVAPLGADCNTNGVPDEYERDCNFNESPDDCDLAPGGGSADCNDNGVPDECEIDQNTQGGSFYCTAFCAPDCNANGTPDECEIEADPSLDCTGNDILDECELDCHVQGESGYGTADSCDIDTGFGGACTDQPCSDDYNLNGIPDECESLGTVVCCTGEESACDDTWSEAKCKWFEGTVQYVAGDCLSLGARCDTGACCASDGSGSCSVTTEVGCTDTFLGHGTTCNPNCCLQPSTGGDLCGDAVPVQLVVPALIPPDQANTVDISGDNSAATPSNCPRLGSDPVWWEAFTVEVLAPPEPQCGMVTIDFCCTDPAFNPYYFALYDVCPCGSDIRADQVVVDEVCGEGSVSLTWMLPPGTYYYPIYSGPNGMLGPYQLHLTAEACELAACCTGETCSFGTNLECKTGGGDWLGAPVPNPLADCFDLPCASGACCLADGTCDDQNGDQIAPAMCTALAGDYHGFVYCSDIQCPVGGVIPEDQCKAGRGSEFITSDAGACLRVADDFQPDNSGTIRDVRWRGMYVDFGSESSALTGVSHLDGTSSFVDCSAGYVDDFTITVYEDAGGFPNEQSLLFSESVIPPRQLVDELNGVPVYEYTATLVSDPWLFGQTCYWIEIQNDRGAHDGCYWLWETSREWFNLYSAQDDDGDWDVDDGNGVRDLAFCLDEDQPWALNGGDCGATPRGACCTDQFLGVCQDNVPVNECSGVFVEDGSCGTTDVCHVACCLANGTCTNTYKAYCEGSGGVSAPGNSCADVCFTCSPDAPALPTDPDHQVHKNRYVSINPFTNCPTALKVTLTDMKRCDDDYKRACTVDTDCTPWRCRQHPDLGLSWWVQQPEEEPRGCLPTRCLGYNGPLCTADADCGGVPGSCQNFCGPTDQFARVDTAPHFQVWNLTTLHIGDCEIIPVATYEIRACLPPYGSLCSDPLAVATILKPDPGKHYGDVVGLVEGTSPNLYFTPPNRIVNVFDLTGYLLTKKNYGTLNKPQAHPTWIDLHGPDSANTPQYILNVSDLTLILEANEGAKWTDRAENRNPGQCPVGRSLPPDPGGTPVTFTLLADTDLIYPEEGVTVTVDVVVYIDSVSDLGAYEVGLKVTGGTAGQLLLQEVKIEKFCVGGVDDGEPCTTGSDCTAPGTCDPRSDYVFGEEATRDAKSLTDKQLSNAKETGGVSVQGQAYLATYTFQPSEGAAGVFTIAVKDNYDQTFLIDSNGVLLASAGGATEVIGVGVDCLSDEHCEQIACQTGSCIDYACVYDNAPQGTPCDDGLFCTLTDECDGNGACVGTGDKCTQPMRPECCESEDRCYNPGNPPVYCD